MTLGEKIRELRKEKGYSLRELAKLAGSASHSYIAAIERGEYDPSLKIVKDIARALNVPTAYLLDIYDQDHSGYDKFKIKENQDMLDNQTNMVKVPILGHIAAGAPILAEEHIEGFKLMPESEVSNGEYFLLKVTGDSMINAGIHDGDLVLIRKQPVCETGEIAAVIVDGENATLKRVYHNNGKLLLQPENPKYKPIMVDNEEVRIVGKAIEVIHKL